MTAPTPVRVAVPAEEAFLRLLRVTAATAAADVAGMARLDDVRLAIDELAAAVMGVAPPGGVLEVAIEVAPRSVAVRGHVRTDRGVPRLSQVGELLVRSICGEHQIERIGDDAVFSFTIDIEPPG